MGTDLSEWIAHPAGEQPEVEEWSAVADTFGGRVHIEWDTRAPVTPLGQLPFFIEYLKQGGLFDGWVADCPLLFTSPNAPRKRNILGTLLLSVLAGHRRYAHVTALRCDAVNPPLLGMNKVVSEDALRRALAKIDETAGVQWLQTHLDYCVRPLLDEPWVLDVDARIKPLYGHQEGAVVGYNPRKPGRSSHCYHTYMLSDLRLVLRVEVHPGDQHNPKHAATGLWYLLAERDWSDAGQGWQGKETTLRLMGWSRQRRVVLLRRQFNRPLALVDRTDPGQPLLGFAEVLGGMWEVWEYAALVTSLDSEILTLGQLYRDRADCENAFDELKNHWGWGGFTTQDLKRCRLLAASVALIYNWWSLFVRLADPDQHREVITSRPLLLQAIARKTQHAGRTTLSVSSTHGEQQTARRAYLRIARFFASLRAKAEQLDAVQRWYRILSEALRKYLRGRQLIPPARFQPG